MAALVTRRDRGARPVTSGHVRYQGPAPWPVRCRTGFPCEGGLGPSRELPQDFNGNARPQPELDRRPHLGASRRTCSAMKLKKQLESGSRGRQVAHGRDDGGGVPDGQPHQSQTPAGAHCKPFGSGQDGIFRVTMSGSSPKFWAQERFTMRTVRFQRSTSLPWLGMLEWTMLED